MITSPECFSEHRSESDGGDPGRGVSVPLCSTVSLCSTDVSLIYLLGSILDTDLLLLSVMIYV